MDINQFTFEYSALVLQTDTTTELRTPSTPRDESFEDVMPKWSASSEDEKYAPLVMAVNKMDSI